MSEGSRFGFDSRPDFRAWLEKNHNASAGIWLQLKKGNRRFTANDALEEALCFGWIDGQIKQVDETFYLKYFSKRRKNSAWSERNKKIATALMEKGQMTFAGTEAIASAKASGKWENKDRNDNSNAWENALAQALVNDPDAEKLFTELSSSRRRQYAGFYCEAKTTETREKRVKKIIEALKTGNKGMLY